jgi:hypothetical protein
VRPPHAKKPKPNLAQNVSDRPLPEPLAVRVPQAAHMLSISERSVWYLISTGKLTVARIGSITLITMASIRTLLDGGVAPRLDVRRAAKEITTTAS